MRVHVSFFGLLLQDLPEAVGADAPEKGGRLVRFLDHPLRERKRENTQQSQRAQLTKYKSVYTVKFSEGRWHTNCSFTANILLAIYEGCELS